MCKRIEEVVRRNAVGSDVRSSLLAALLEFRPELEELLNCKAQALLVALPCARKCGFNRAHTANRARNLPRVIARLPRRVVGHVA